MKTHNNNESIQEGKFNVPVYQENLQNDEIDLRELFQVIWGYKWLIMCMCVCAIVGSVFYALNAQEWWVAKGKIIEPQLNNVASLYKQAEEVKAILKAGGGDITGNAGNTGNTGNTGRADVISDLFVPETLFKNFINQFNSSSNKKSFLENNSAFLAFLNLNEIKLPTNKSTVENQLVRQSYRSVLNNWFNEINASLDSKTNVVSLSFRSDTKASSSALLNQYIDFISNKVKDSQLGKFNLFIETSKNELNIKISMSEERAKQNLNLLLHKTKLSYQIASTSGLEGYQPNFNVEEDLFQINLGAKALKSKINVLKSITDLGLLDPNIAELKFTLSALNNLKSITDSSFVPFQYLENVEPPLNRSKPKRALIVVLATLLAGMLSIFIALTHHFLTKKDAG